MTEPTPRIENAPYHSHRHAGLTIEGWSRAGIQSYWRIPELRIGFDLGAIPWDFTSTGTWFVTHGHVDHLYALPAYLARRSMLKHSPPTVYVPTEIVDDVLALLAAWRTLDRGTQACNIVGVAAGDRINISQLHYVTAFNTSHPVPSRGYIVWEHRQKLKDEYIGLPGDKLKELRESGTAITHGVPVPLLSYTGDTGPAGLDAHPAVCTSKVLITELSFARPEHSKERIHAYGHLHLDDFIERAERFQNELIIAAHLTSRDEPADFQRWANERLPNGLRERLKVWGTE